MSDGPSGYLIERVLSAWAATRHHLADIDADAETREEDPFLALAAANDKVSWIQTWMARAERNAKRLADAVRAERAELAIRQKRFEARQEHLRAGLTATIQIAIEPDKSGKRTLELPVATVTLAPGQGHVLQVIDEAKIPARFFVEETVTVRRLNTDALMAALRDERIDEETGEVLPPETIDGAVLTKAPPRLTIRSK